MMFILKPLELDHLSSGLKNNCCRHTKIEITMGSFSVPTLLSLNYKSFTQTRPEHAGKDGQVCKQSCQP